MRVTTTGCCGLYNVNRKVLHALRLCIGIGGALTMPMNSTPPVIPSHRFLWIVLACTVFGAFAVLGFFGREVYRQAPPLPERIVTTDGTLVGGRERILDGQQAWQSMGGMQVGSIWGHGAYQAPDWSADWLHREILALSDILAQQQYAQPMEALTSAQAAGVRQEVRDLMRANDYDAATDTLTIPEERAAAWATVAMHYDGLFGDDPALAELRQDYALAPYPVPDGERRARIADFFAWTAWACAARRPDSQVSYTNNWPHEPLIDNRPTAANVLWSITSVLLLIAAIAGVVWWRARHGEEHVPTPPKTDPLLAPAITTSMRALRTWIVVVAGLFAAQVLLGAITAHYTVSGDHVYGIPLAEWLPYAVTRTWHIQLAMFWIAASFLLTGLFLGPLIGGREPRYQAAGVWVLLAAVVVVVVGSLAGQWFSVQQRLGLDTGFWFGHQGYEYVDLGRAWQIALLAGLFIWLFLMLRAMWPALRNSAQSSSLLRLFAAATIAIGLMYGAGLFYGARTHLSVMEYWRWWVIHLWVEGFFEVFATAAVALVLTKLGLLRTASAGAAVLAATTLFLIGGIPGTFHHLYFSGTPTSIMAIGACFSALEVVPLTLIGIEAVQTARLGRAAPWMRRWRWPVRCFLAVAFWNFLGAGVFGFMINPPVALYYLQGLNTTPVHAHGALFGVYGLLSLGLILTVARLASGERPWPERALAVAFWGTNIGLGLMIVLSLLPIGVAQGWASIEYGFWYARSADFLQMEAMQTLRWLRIVGDVVFLVGVGGWVVATAGIVRGWARPAPVAAVPVGLPGGDVDEVASEEDEELLVGAGR